MVCKHEPHEKDTAAIADGMCPICLANEVSLLIKAVSEDPDKWGFETLLYIGRRILDEVYPEDIFIGSSGSTALEYIVALRNAIKQIEEVRARRLR